MKQQPQQQQLLQRHHHHDNGIFYMHVTVSFNLKTQNYKHKTFCRSNEVSFKQLYLNGLKGNYL